jgi:hypothetical protein
MAIPCCLRRIGDLFERHQTSAPAPATGWQQIGECMRRRVLQSQSGTPPAQDPSGKPAANAPDPAKDSQRKTDEFVEASQAINGPAGNPECVWLGRRVVGLMWRDDLDTAFRHLDLYDRFGCPGGHVQATFRCLTRFGSQIDDKVPRSLTDRIHACWINPGAQPQAAVAATPAAPAATAGAAPAAPATPTPAPTPAAPAK